MGIIPRTLFWVGEDFVGTNKFLERGGGVGGRGAGLHKLVGVALEGELFVGAANLVLGAALGEA